MPNIIELDFTGAPPSEGPSFSDHIPPGAYDLRIAKAETMTSSGGKPMVVVNFKVAGGPETGKKLVDMFVLPRTAEESKVGLSRLHLLLVACGSKEITGRTNVNLDNLTGRLVKSEVEDNIMPASDKYPERVTSRPAKYLRREVAAQQATQPTTQPAPTPTPAAATKATTQKAPAAPTQAARTASPAQAPVAPPATTAQPTEMETMPWDTPTEDSGANGVEQPAAAVGAGVASNIADDLEALFGS